MRNFLGTLFILFSTITSFSQDLKYYLPDSVTYNPTIPKPKEIIYHEVGEWHVTHDRLVNYMKAVADAAPDRVKMEIFGFTYEHRPQVLLTITSPKNHQNLQQIRQQHVQLTDASKSASLNIEKMPVVVWVGHSIHGNEPSGANAALVSTYYLAAAQGKQIDDLLDNVVILIDPAFNPDGLQRFSTWVNQHRSKNLVVDPNSREFNEVWPGGRFNHYWFDLNRDWLPAVHVESQNRLKKFHEWKPNILTDHHEMGSNTTFFFQPGVPSRVNPLTPDKNQELTAKIGTYHAAFLDRIGSLYFTKEGYDDFYYGKGSTYPDVNGAIGILFEQASSRGHAQQTSNGILRFPFTIKNQFTTTLSTLEAAKALRTDLLSFQRDFYKSVQAEGNASTVKAYVIGDEKDRSKTNEFITMLQRHEIDVYGLNNNIKIHGSEEFKKGSSFIIPANQKQHRLIRAIFEKTLTYKDSLFYDITSWTMPLAYGLQYAELKAAQYNSNLLGEKYTPGNYKGEVVGGRSDYAYLLEWSEFNAPAALYSLQNSGVSVKVATNPIELIIAGNRKKFNYGTILIPVQSQNKPSAELFNIVTNVAQKFSLPVHAVTTGASILGSDLGSNRFISVSKPVIATVTGSGVDAINAGEFWHLMDQRFNIPISQLEPAVFNRVSLDKYNTIVLVGGTYADINKEKLKTWVQNGGTLILLEEAVSWAAQNGIGNVTLKKTKPVVDSTARLSYIEREQIEGAQQVRGAILRAEADLTHPLAYGYTQPFLSTFKANKVFIEPGKNPFTTPFYYKDKPLESGWVSRENLNNIKNSAAVVVNGLGSGKIVSIADNPNFRGFWLGGSKLMMNAIFFGKMIVTNFSAIDE